jgi:hypothetical protein
MDVVVDRSIPDVRSLDAIRRTPLAQISRHDARAIARRVLNLDGEPAAVEVARFGSAI